MKPIRCILIGIWTLGLLSSLAVAGPFSDLVIFGDSLSDVGNIASVTGGFIPETPGPYYYQDRFSDGPIYADVLAAGLGLDPVEPSSDDGSDFAYGGARTTGTGGLLGFFIRDVDDQVDMFLDSRTPDPAALFTVFAGANDLIAVPFEEEIDVAVPVGSLTDDIERLANAGATQFLVLNLPLLGLTPRYNGNPGDAAVFNQRSLDFNSELAMGLDELEFDHPSLTIHRFDVAGLINQAVADPAAFGLTNVTDPAAPGLEPGDSSYDENQIVSNPETYLFWDDLHPTTAAHALLGQSVLASVQLTGDYNSDGEVTAADYTVWQDTLGSTTDLRANGDNSGASAGVIDEADYLAWKENYGMTLGSGAGAGEFVVTVPEPSGGVLGLLAILGTCNLDRRRRGRTP